MRQPDELIQCPRCSKPQSRRQYEAFACWDCGSIAPLPPESPGLLYELRSDNELSTVRQDEDVETARPTQTGPAEYVDESRIKKMSEL